MGYPRSAKQSWAVGGSIFAAVMMLMIGVFQILMGIAAIVKNQFFVQVGNSYAYSINTRAWGWIHLVIGAIVLIAGVGLFSLATWARVIGIAAAGLSAIANFFFMPYYPLWSLLVIALDVFVIWALAVVGRATAGMEPAGGYQGATQEQRASTAWPTNPPTTGGATPRAADIKPPETVAGAEQPTPDTTTSAGGPQGRGQSGGTNR